MLCLDLFSEMWYNTVNKNYNARGDVMFELTNEQRKCMGIPEVMSDWELVCLEQGFYCYFQGDVIRKIILILEEDVQKRQKATYHEYNVIAMTKDNRTVLCPKTTRGKDKKLIY